MIDIRIAGQSLDLPEDISITLELLSPFFQDETGGNTHSFSFTLPWTDHNQQILERAEIILKGPQIYVWDAMLWLMGLPWKEASMELSVADGQAYQASLKLGEGRVVELMEDTPMRALSLGGSRVLTTAVGASAALDVVNHANDTAANPSTYDYLFPVIYNPSFYDGLRPALSSTEDHTQYLNYWLTSYNFELAALVNGDPGQFTLVPQPRALYIIRQAIAEIGFQLEESAWTSDPEIADLLSWNLVSIDRSEEVQIPVGNTWIETNYYAKAFSLASCTPDISLRQWLGALCRLFGLGLVQLPNGALQIIARKEILASTSVTDWTEKGIEGYRSSFPAQMGHNLSSESDAMDVLAPEQFEEVAGTEPGNSATSYATLPNVTVVGQIWYVKDENAWYRRAVVTGQVTLQYFWEYIGQRNEKLLKGDADQDIVSEAGPIWTYRGKRHGGPGEWLLPAADQPGNSPLYGLPRHDFAPRFYFWRGLRSYAGGTVYPFAESANKHGNYSTYWHGESGLYAIWWKDWLDMIANSIPVEYPLDLNLADIRAFDWRKRVRVTVREGYAQGFVQSLRITITQRGIDSAIATLLLQ